ncbi:hypothetical protein [Mesorhizobium sp. J428]|uniref:hypothetical protein n=1 Tax=Mesorhizobium sp. J428 TaxID=2898440 RepID=UPI0021509326|nr:hypothetical protein [Mesorhizobium sp. J428]MCR5855905.1 hypothetical protein [Mesorhizobium sp. J428]
MDWLFAGLIDLPNWVIHGLVGAILGGLGGLIGGALQKVLRIPHLASVLAVVGAVTSTQVTKSVVIPRIVTASLNADLPKKGDDVTTIVRIDYDGRRYVYHYELDDSLPGVTAETMKTGLLSDLCAHWKPEFAAGRVDGADYNYRLRGEVISFTIEPTDCT